MTGWEGFAAPAEAEYVARYWRAWREEYGYPDDPASRLVMLAMRRAELGYLGFNGLPRVLAAMRSPKLVVGMVYWLSRMHGGFADVRPDTLAAVCDTTQGCVRGIVDRLCRAGVFDLRGESGLRYTGLEPVVLPGDGGEDRLSPDEVEMVLRRLPC